MRIRLAALLVAAAGCNVLDPMLEQPKVKPYRDSDFYSDGISMRLPPAETVALERPVDPAVAAGVGPDAKPVARIPVPVTAELLATGRRRFEIVCGTCHGLTGDGRSLVARNMSLRPPPSLHENPGRPDGYYYQVISQGFGLMPSYAADLPVAERWAVVAYLRALQLSQHVPLELVPAEVRARLEKEPR